MESSANTNLLIFIIVTGMFFWLTHAYVLIRLACLFQLTFKSQWFWWVFLYTLVFFGFRITSETFLFASLQPVITILNYFVGWVILALPVMVLHDLLLLPLKLASIIRSNRIHRISLLYLEYQKYIAFMLFICINILFITGLVNFYKDVQVKHINIATDKITRSYSFIHLSDVQLGSVRKAHIHRIEKTINNILRKNTIDFVVNTGDYVDTKNYAEQDLAPLSMPNLTKFFVLGNHEFYHDTTRILNMVKNQNYHILREKNYLFKEINLIGIDDSRDSNHVGDILEKNTHLVKPRLFNILLYHRPTGVYDAKKAGIDLMLAGHTHGGQIFPYTFLVYFIYEYAFGFVELEKFILYTTSGAGLWGPRLRLGSTNEIIVFHLTPTKE